MTSLECLMLRALMGLLYLYILCVDPIALISWLIEEDNVSGQMIESKMNRFLRVSQKVNHLIVRLTDAKAAGDQEPDSCAKDWGLELKS